MNPKLSLLILLLSPVALADDTRLLNAIQAVETGGEKDPAHAVGDSGKALGWLQMWKAVHTDAKERDKTLPAYRTCAADSALSRRVATVYWTRYGCKTDKAKALCWHYGPSGRKVGFKDRHHYWTKVQKEMK